MAMLNKSAYDSAHTKSVKVYILIDDSANSKGRDVVAGRIVASFSDNPAGSVCTATVHVFSGPLAFVPGTSGKAGGYGYDKFSAAVWDAMNRAIKFGETYRDPAGTAKLRELKLADFAGAGDSAVAEWFKANGYTLVSVL